MNIYALLLDHEHKYVVVCKSDEAVEAVVQEGLRTFVVKDGVEIDAELDEKCWKFIATFEDIYALFEKLRILFE